MSINGINASEFSGVNKALDPSGKLVNAGKKMRKFAANKIDPRGLLQQPIADKLELSTTKKAQALDLTGEKKATMIGGTLDAITDKKGRIIEDIIDPSGEGRPAIIGTEAIKTEDFEKGFLKGPAFKLPPVPDTWTEKPSYKQPWDEKMPTTPPIVSLPDIFSGKPAENPFEIKPWIDL